METVGKKKSVLVIFPYAWLPYFSTVLNLYEILAGTFEVEILTLQPGYFTNKKMEDMNVTYVSPPRYLGALFSKLRRIFNFIHVDFDADGWLQALTLLYYGSRKKPSCVIAADPLCLWVAQRLVRLPHFLCVDISVGDPFFARINKEAINSVIISNPQRYEYLFADCKIRCCFVENSPVYQPLASPCALEERTGLVYCGTSIPQWGIYDCLNFMERYPGYVLTLQGAVPAEIAANIKSRYGDLIRANRLKLNESYLSNAELSPFLNQFKIGFCLYNIDEIEEKKRFNQLHGSYGKLYAYYLAGVPVVATRIPGMRSVDEFETGILVDDHSPANLHEAIARIEANYAYYVANCWKAAQHFDFNKKIQPFVEFISGSGE